jgi:hypothetical protein
MRAAWLVVLGACGRLRFDATGAGTDAADDAQQMIDAPPPPIMRIGQSGMALPSAPPTIDVAVPVGVQPGDFLVFAVYCDLGTAQISPAPGWDMRFDQLNPTNMFRASSFDHRVATGDPTMYSFPVSSASDIAWALGAYRGVGAQPYDVDIGALAAGSLTGLTIDYTAPSQTTTAYGDELVLMVLNDGGSGTATWTPPIGGTEVYSALKVGMFDLALAEPGPTGDQLISVTTTGGVGSHGAVRMLALRR